MDELVKFSFAQTKKDWLYLSKNYGGGADEVEMWETLADLMLSPSRKQALACLTSHIGCVSQYGVSDEDGKNGLNFYADPRVKEIFERHYFEMPTA